MRRSILSVRHFAHDCSKEHLIMGSAYGLGGTAHFDPATIIIALAYFSIMFLMLWHSHTERLHSFEDGAK